MLKHVYVDVGYGINTDNVHLKPDAYSILISEYISYDKFANYHIEISGTMPEYTIDTIDEFVENYENYNGYTGFWPLLADTINENIGPNCDQFVYEDGYLYVPAINPDDENEKMSILTKAEIENILQEYIPLISENVVPLSHVKIVEFR